MLESIQLRNFKAARNLAVRLEALTLLAGLNGSGKSTVMQSIAVLRQSHVGGICMDLNFGGPLVFLGQWSDVISEGAYDEAISFSVRESGREFTWVAAAPESGRQTLTSRPADAARGFWTTPHFQYLQADRIVPRTLYPRSNQSVEQSGFLGGHGEFTADFLATNAKQTVSEGRLCARQGVDLDSKTWDQIAPTPLLLDQVAGWLQQISPGVHLQAEPVAGTDEVVLRFRYIGGAAGSSNYYRPTNVGFGLTYSLPILAACLSAPPGSLLLIENPEAHLHPQGQLKMGELLARCAADGVQCLVETHSDHILNGVRLSVKKALLQADSVALHNFRRDVVTGECYSEMPALTADGQISNWPKGFFDQWEKSLDALLD
ncbi:MAG: DUF3696 domain-containing protein [Burkholderiales bacterium]